MRARRHPALPLGGPDAAVSGAEATAWRVRTVLETRPGRVPWRPGFGCDLEGLTGRPADPALVREARLRVEAALTRWLPDLTIRALRVGVRTRVGASELHAHRQVPVAEAALLRLGADAELVLELELDGPDGPVALSAPLAL